MAIMIRAELETRNFIFEVYGETEEHCVDLLKEAWKEHAKHYDMPDSEIPQDFIDDLTFAEIEVGMVMRDGHVIYDEPQTSKGPSL